MFFLLVSVLVFQACNNPYFGDDIKDIESEIKGELYRGVSVEYDREIGIHLSFSSMDDAKAILNYLQKRTDEQKYDWEQGIKYGSLRSAEKSYQPNVPMKYIYPEGVFEYPDKAMSTILNPGGYVKIGGNVYHDTMIGDLVYVIDEYKVKSVFQDTSVKDKSTCYRSDGSNFTLGRYSGPIPTAKVEGYIDHYTNWVSGRESLNIYTYYYNQASNGAGGWYSANAPTVGMYYTYNIIIDGVSYISNGTSSYRNNQSSHWVQVGYGWDVCIGYVYGTHSAAGLTTYTRVEKP